jgi:hypothetical protein
MPIDFHAEENRHTYAARRVDSRWLDTMSDLGLLAGQPVVEQDRWTVWCARRSSRAGMDTEGRGNERRGRKQGEWTKACGEA